MGTLLLCGCTQDGRPNFSALSSRGATVAFDSIDGPPAGQFQALVASLNDEAQSRQLAVISRDNPSAYRVRGYLAAKVAKGQTTITWVWDVFDAGERRALRITGEETASADSRRPGDAWTAVDDVMLRRIARASVEQLAAFLISPEATPSGTPVAFMGGVDSVLPTPRLPGPGGHGAPGPNVALAAAH